MFNQSQRTVLLLRCCFRESKEKVYFFFSCFFLPYGIPYTIAENFLFYNTYIFDFILESFDEQVLKDTLNVPTNVFHGLFPICLHSCSLFNANKFHFILNDRFIHALQLVMK